MIAPVRNSVQRNAMLELHGFFFEYTFKFLSPSSLDSLLFEGTLALWFRGDDGPSRGELL